MVDGRRLARDRLRRREGPRHAEHCGVMGRVDILTGTLGKALGGASGGYTSGRRVVEWLRQRSRPMKALVKAKAEVGIWMEEIPVPEVGHNDILIKVGKTAICGTDIHIYNWDAWAAEDHPRAHGRGARVRGPHRGSGLRGARAQGRGPGLRRRAHHLRPLPQLQGGQAPPLPQRHRRGRQPSGLLRRVRLRSGRQRLQGAGHHLRRRGRHARPLGNATHTALSFDLVGEDVLITGAGPIGIMAARIARFCGARHVVITDVNDYRLDLARKMGVSRAVNVGSESLAQVMADCTWPKASTWALRCPAAPTPSAKCSPR
jgi:threonine 3-dehydrogenase